MVPGTRPSGRILELRLLNAWIQDISTNKTLHPTCHSNEVLARIVPPMIIGYDYLMDILLACIATYLRSTNPHDIQLIDASHRYAVRSIHECQAQIRSGINASNADGLFVASLLVAIYAFASREYAPAQDLSCAPADAVGLPFAQVIRQYQGIKTIKDAGYEWIQHNEQVSPLLDKMPVRLPECSSVESSPPFFAFLLVGLSDETQVAAETLHGYQLAIEYLNYLVSRRYPPGMTGFPMVLTPTFMELLGARDPRALAIIGNFLAVLRLNGVNKFITKAVNMEFLNIMRMLPQSWAKRMEWAGRIMESHEFKENWP
jgi:hypothetical protein